MSEGLPFRATRRRARVVHTHLVLPVCKEAHDGFSADSIFIPYSKGSLLGVLLEQGDTTVALGFEGRIDLICIAILGKERDVVRGTDGLVLQVVR